MTNPSDNRPIASPERIEIKSNILLESSLLIIKVGEEIDTSKGKKLKYTFLLFVNGGSGDSKASLLTKLDVNNVRLL